MWEFNGYGTDVRWLAPPSNLIFHYTKLSTALEFILPTGTIRFGDLCRTNDPYERSISSMGGTKWGDGGATIVESSLPIIEELHKRFRIFCTTGDSIDRCVGVRTLNLGRGFAIPALWAHYAEQHKGVCFAFDKDKLKSAVLARAESRGDKVYIGDISYGDPPGIYTDIFDVDLINDADTRGDILSHIDRYHQTILFFKDLMWKYENEYRVGVLCLNHSPFEVDISDSLVGMIVSHNFPDCYDLQIINARNRFGINSARLDWVCGMPEIFRWPNDW